MPYQIPLGIQQYLLNLYDRFDKDADAIPVLRIEDRSSQGYYHSGHLEIKNFRLILTPGTQQITDGTGEHIVHSNAENVEIDLMQPSVSKKPYIFNGVIVTPTITIEELYDQVLSAGFQVSKVEPRFANASATTLAEMDEVYDGRSFLSISTSVLWRILLPIALEGKGLRGQVDQATRQFDLHLAESIWLDRIGNLYGLRRREFESDEHFRRRIDFHVVRPHANNTALEYLVQRLYGFNADVTDGSLPEWFLTDDESSVTYVRGLRDIHRTVPGQVAFFSVAVDGLYDEELESPQHKWDREIGKGQWLYTDTSSCTLAGYGQDDAAYTTVPGNKYYGTVLENRDMFLIDTEEERGLYRDILQYKAAGSQFILRHRKQVRADDMNMSKVFTKFSFQTSVGTTILSSVPVLSPQLVTDDLSVNRGSSSFPQHTTLAATPLVNNVPLETFRLLSTR